MIIDRYGRNVYVEKFSVDGTRECDFLRNGILEYKFKQKTTPFYVTAVYKHRPDLIALDVYGNQMLWWVILYYNGINDVYNELVEGIVINIPNKSEIEEFLSTSPKYKKQRRLIYDRYCYFICWVTKST